MDLGIRDGNGWQKCGDMDVMWDWLYDMSWESVNLENMRVACSPYGGPIAMVRDRRKMVVLRGGSAQPVVRIFTCSGRELARFMWTGAHIIGMGWTDEQNLLIVDTQGQVHTYSVHGQKLPLEFSFGQAVENEGLMECCVYGGGVIALTNQCQVWAVTDLHDPRPQQLADPMMESPPHCMEVLESSGIGVEVVLSSSEGVIVVDAQQAVDQPIEHAPISLMCMSPNGEFVAAFTENGKDGSSCVMVLSADFTENHLTFEPPIDGPPLQIAWCGNDVVVLYFEGTVMLVGYYGDWLPFPTTEPVVLVTELDGLRVISTGQHHLMRRVPHCMLDVLSPESDHPGRQLYLAREAFDEQDARADKVLRDIKDRLRIAIDACIEVAGAENDVTKQRTALKASCYGVAFCNQYPSAKLYNMCQKLRVLNAVRDPSVGMPLTMTQLDSLTMPVVVARLVNAHQHLLALRICEALEMSQDTILRHWACARISADASSTDDIELKDTLAKKLSGCSGIRYATIAEHAQAQGRKELAALLLDYEACAADQVPLLLRLGEDQRALDRAVESGDTDLVYLALFHMYKRMTNLDRFQDFLVAIRSRPAAYRLFLKYCKAQEPDVAEQVYLMTGSGDGLAEVRFKEALSLSLSLPQDPSAEEGVALSNLRDKVVSLLREAAEHYGKAKKNEFHVKAAEEFALLRKDQARLHHTTGRNMFVGLSTVDTIKQCIRLGNTRTAADIKRQFNIPDKHFYWIKIRTLAEQGDWEGLEEFGMERRPPVGWEPFIQMCIKHHAPTERTERFIGRLPDGEPKVDWYTKVGLNMQAARTAESLQNADLLTKIQSIVGPNSHIGLRTAQMLERMSLSKGQQHR